jgi:hypothetical protein
MLLYGVANSDVSGVAADIDTAALGALIRTDHRAG